MIGGGGGNERVARDGLRKMCQWKQGLAAGRRQTGVEAGRAWRRLNMWCSEDVGGEGVKRQASETPEHGGGGDDGFASRCRGGGWNVLGGGWQSRCSTGNDDDERCWR